MPCGRRVPRVGPSPSPVPIPLGWSLLEGGRHEDLCPSGVAIIATSGDGIETHSAGYLRETWASVNVSSCIQLTILNESKDTSTPELSSKFLSTFQVRSHKTTSAGGSARLLSSSFHGCWLVYTWEGARTLLGLFCPREANGLPI